MFTLIDIIFGMIGHSIILIIGDLVVGIIPGDTIGIDLIIGGIVGIMVPWHNPGYNVIWNSSRENNNVAYISGRRGSRNIDININNNNIENTIVRRYNNPRKNVNNSNLNNIVNTLRNNYNVKPRVYNNPNNVPNNNIIRNNSGRPVIPNYNNNNNFNNSNINSRSSSPIRSYSPPPSNNISRGSSISSGGSSRGGNSRGKN